MRHHYAVYVFGSILGLITGGCGSEPGENADVQDHAHTDAGDASRDAQNQYEPATSLDEGCSQNAEAECALLSYCDLFRLALFYGDEESCRVTVKQRCLVSANASGSRWEASQLTACAIEKSSMSCDRYLYGDSWNFCGTLSGGQLTQGDSCQTDSQCQSNECLGTEGLGCGTCTGNVGAPCNPGLCKRGLRCASEGGRGICRAPALLGEPCGRENPCVDEAVCENGRCTKADLPGFGEPCALSKCSSGLICGRYSEVCEHYPIAYIGESCGAYDPCAGNAYCDNEQHCIARARPGEECAKTICLEGFRCVSGICEPARLPNCN